jgi:hypothetical protein
MAGPRAKSATALARETGIPQPTLSRWLREAGGVPDVDAKIQRVKRLACGFRNRGRFRNALHSDCGGLDLHPVSAGIPHTKP